MVVILTVLKITAIVLIVILSLILLLALAILFVPIRYRAVACRKSDAEVFSAGIVFSWLLSLIRLELYYKDELTYVLRVLGIPIKRSGGKKKRGGNSRRRRGRRDSQPEAVIKNAENEGREDGSGPADAYSKETGPADTYSKETDSEALSSRESDTADTYSEESDTADSYSEETDPTGTSSGETDSEGPDPKPAEEAVKKEKKPGSGLLSRILDFCKKLLDLFAALLEKGLMSLQVCWKRPLILLRPCWKFSWLFFLISWNGSVTSFRLCLKGLRLSGEGLRS